jgi:N-formylglutamate deformylase
MAKQHNPKLVMTVPHAGERVPPQCKWLQGLNEKILMCDVDRYVDKLYAPMFLKENVVSIIAPWHRYAVDLNRIPSDVDVSSLEGSPHPAGKFKNGFHWVQTTQGDTLIKSPLSKELHLQLLELIFHPFHRTVTALYEEIKNIGPIFHLDVHSMPSLGTSMHRDPGERRADIVVSDSLGKSSRTDFVDLVITSYVRAGFKVAYNWPYVGGRITEQYGRPSDDQHVVQVELNRSLYMDEVSKKLLPEWERTQTKLAAAVELVLAGLPKL